MKVKKIDEYVVLHKKPTQKEEKTIFTGLVLGTTTRGVSIREEDGVEYFIPHRNIDYVKVQQKV